jgi:hypothetical protein
MKKNHWQSNARNLLKAVDIHNSLSLDPIDIQEISLEDLRTILGTTDNSEVKSYSGIFVSATDFEACCILSTAQTIHANPMEHPERFYTLAISVNEDEITNIDLDDVVTKLERDELLELIAEEKNKSAGFVASAKAVLGRVISFSLRSNICSDMDESTLEARFKNALLEACRQRLSDIETMEQEYVEFHKSLKNVLGAVIVLIVLTIQAVFAQETAPTPSPQPATTQTVITTKQIEELPLINRTFLPLLQTVPGVSSDLFDEQGFGQSNTSFISINGLRRNGVNYFLDGASLTNVGSNIVLINSPALDAINEVRILTSNYNAEFGRSGGGVVLLSSRAGGNDFHGSLFEFVRNDLFNANNFFSNRIGAPKPQLRYNNFGGTLSGPVLIPNVGDGGPALIYDGKDKTTFFFSEEVRRIRRGVAISSATVPSLLERQGNFSQMLGQPLCLVGTVITQNCSAGGAVPILVTDTSGATIQARQNMIFRADGRAYAGNIIPVSDIDPRSLGFLEAFPLPNAGNNSLTFANPNSLNTRQETIRIDHKFDSANSIFGRYAQEGVSTEEGQGLFFSSFLPNVGTTRTNAPGKVFVVSYTGNFPKLTNETSFNFSSGEINSKLIGRGTRADYPNAETIREIFPENAGNIIPTISTRFSPISAGQNYSNEYASIGIREIVSYAGKNHLFKFGGEIFKEYQNENVISNTQGSFGFSSIQSQGFTGSTAITGTGDSFASFLLGRANTYSEAKTDFRTNLRFGRREFFAQDTWKARPNLTINIGLRYQYFVNPTDRNGRLGSFNPALYDRSRVTCANPNCTTFVRALTDENNGIEIGNSIVEADKNNFSPRFGFVYSFNPKTVVRAGYGLYFEQLFVGVFDNAAFSVPAFNQFVSYTSTANSVITFDNPDRGIKPGEIGNRNLTAIDQNFRTPEVQQWSIGIERELFRNAVLNVFYVGTKGDFLIRRRNTNFVTPADVVRVGPAAINTARPFLGYGTITNIETSGKSRYNGLLSSFDYRSGNLTLTAAYTFSKTLTNSTNDRDIIDEPQNPLSPDEYAEARTSRPHIVSLSYIYELPFLSNSGNKTFRFLLSNWQIAGITQIESGAPIPRVTVADTLQGQRGLYPNLIGNPNGGLAGTIDPVSGLPFIFDPTAFAPAPVGQFGNAPRSFGRLPGRFQTNLALSKNFYFRNDTLRLQLRAEAFNVFNHTQFTGVSTVLPTFPNITFGLPTGTRLPREFQLGAKFLF